jgi:flagellar FliL protein
MAKSPPKKEEVSQAEAKPAKGRRGKLIIAALAAVVLLVAAGAATVVLLGRQSADPTEGEDEAAHASQEAPVFVNLEAFTVNLQMEQGEQFLQTVVTLKLADKSVGEHIKTYMPELRHRMLLRLSGKRASEVATPEGREQLAEELRGIANAVLYPAMGKRPKATGSAKPIASAHAAQPQAPDPEDPVQGVLFTSFIVQ